MPAPNTINYNSFTQNNPINQGYDLAAEKRRIEEGTAEIKKELLQKWNQRYSNAQIFPSAISAMNLDLVFFLLSFEHALLYNDLAKKFALSKDQRDALPHVVWSLCQTENWENLNNLLQKNLDLNSSDCDRIAEIISSKIISKARQIFSQKSTPRNSQDFQKQNTAALIKMPIFQALKEIPEIGEQIITSQHIKILSFPEPVRPSLANWLADYTSYFGYEKHSPIEIGNYLFHSENTRKMNPSDRQKLTYILKAFNDEIPVSINKATKQIIIPSLNNIPSVNKNAPEALRSNIKTSSPVSFQNGQNPSASPVRNIGIMKNNPPQNQVPQKKPITPSNPTPANTNQIQEKGDEMQNSHSNLDDNKMTFSSPQKLPYEYEKDSFLGQNKSFSPSQSPNNLPVKSSPSSVPSRPNTIILEKKPEPPRPSGKNVVNLREI